MPAQSPESAANTSIDWKIPPASIAGIIPVPFVLFLFAAIAVWCLDSPLARMRPYLHLPSFLIDVLERIETFGHGVGLVVVLIAVWALDPARRRCLPRLIAATFGTGLAANVIKLMVGRVRPHAWVDPTGGTLTSQFGGWFPLGFNGGAEQSFPSAHTASAVGLALGLAALYPRGTRLFLMMAVLVGVQRAVFCAHYVSDVFAGAGLAWLIVSALFRASWIERRFRRIECPVGAETALPTLSRAA
jgi:membrane-associated phospholipid phosphatase